LSPAAVVVDHLLEHTVERLKRPSDLALRPLHHYVRYVDYRQFAAGSFLIRR
jgi:hypothetical protein